jgi:hypothetical protein
MLHTPKELTKEKFPGTHLIGVWVFLKIRYGSLEGQKKSLASPRNRTP